MISGIYLIKNQVNGHRYIGSSINLKRRWQNHLTHLRRGCHRNQHLQRAFDRYGEATFVFSSLEVIERQMLIVREQYFLDALKPEYNIALVADNPMMGRRHTVETKRKMSEAQAGERHSMYGKHHTEEARAKMSVAHSHLSEETRCKMREAHKGKPHPNRSHRQSAEARKKLSVALKGRSFSIETRRKMSESHIGLHPSSETRRKMSEAQKARWRRLHAAQAAGSR